MSEQEGARHLIAESEDTMEQGGVPPPSPEERGTETAPAIVEPDTEADDDDDENNNTRMEGANSPPLPRHFGMPSPTSSTSSSLSDTSAGLLPAHFVQQAAAAALQQAEQQQQQATKTESFLETVMSRIRHQDDSQKANNNTPAPDARGTIGGNNSVGSGGNNSGGNNPFMMMPTRQFRGAFHRVDSASTGSLRGPGSQNSSNDWGYGWYEDVHNSEQFLAARAKSMQSSSPHLFKRKGDDYDQQKPAAKQRTADELGMIHPDAAAMAVTAPTYVLEESLSSQKLWKHTAGQRPPQPVEERAFYEKMWSQNFARSQVKYNLPQDVLTSPSPISLNPFAEGVYDPASGAASEYAIATQPPVVSDQGAVAEATLMSLMNDPAHRGEDDKGQAAANNPPLIVKGQGSDGDLAVLVRGVNAFGTTVSKSFARPAEKGGVGGGIDTINISIASYRVVESKRHGKYAQFLVIYREGSIRDTVGVWKRYRDFEELARIVTCAHDGCASVIANVSPLSVTEEPETEHLPNAITSWRLLKKRQRWYRCLDAGYLSLKVFLLERFLHDILFESTSPKLLREFVGAGTDMS